MPVPYGLLHTADALHQATRHLLFHSYGLIKWLTLDGLIRADFCDQIKEFMGRKDVIGCLLSQLQYVCPLLLGLSCCCANALGASCCRVADHPHVST